MTRPLRLLALICVAAGLSAHPNHGAETGLAAGLTHPMLGWDHLLAMVAVGLLAVRLGGRWRWLLPTSFLSALAVGSLALTQLGSSPLEWAVAASVIALGLLIAARPVPAAALAVCIVAGLLHGHAHGAEGGGVGFNLGMLLGSALLHAAGLGFALLVTAGHRHQIALRSMGAAVGVAGVGLTALTLG